MKKSYLYLWLILGILVVMLIITFGYNYQRQASIPVVKPIEPLVTPVSNGEIVNNNLQPIHGKVDSVSQDRLVVLDNGNQKQEFVYDKLTAGNKFDPYLNKLVPADVKNLGKNLGVSVGYILKDSNKLAVTVDVAPEYEKTLTITSIDQTNMVFSGKLDDASKEDIFAVTDQTKYRQPGNGEADIEGLSWSDLVEGQDVTVDCDYDNCFSNGYVNAASILIWK